MDSLNSGSVAPSYMTQSLESCVFGFGGVGGPGGCWNVQTSSFKGRYGSPMLWGNHRCGRLVSMDDIPYTPSSFMESTRLLSLVLRG